MKIKYILKGSLEFSKYLVNVEIIKRFKDIIEVKKCWINCINGKKKML